MATTFDRLMQLISEGRIQELYGLLLTGNALLPIDASACVQTNALASKYGFTAISHGGAGSYNLTLAAFKADGKDLVLATPSNNGAIAVAVFDPFASTSGTLVIQTYVSGVAADCDFFVAHGRIA